MTMREPPHVGLRSRLAGNWTILKGAARQRWGRLTRDEIEEIAGRHEKLAGKLQKVYGLDRAQAEAEVDAFVKANLETLERGRDSGGSH